MLLKVMSKTKLVFDIDGTLIDTNRSYRLAIRKTVEFLTKESVYLSEIDFLKNQKGFNNDWYAAYVLANLKCFQVAADKYLSLKLNKKTEKIPFEKVKDVFQTFYLGNSRYKSNFFDIKSNGLWEKETLIFEFQDLEKLKDRYGLLSIITGRTYEEAVYALEHFNMVGFFDQIISVEDREKLTFDEKPMLQKIPIDKSNPIYFYQIKDIGFYDKIFYFGDNIADMQLVSNARNFLPIYSGLLLQSYPKKSRNSFIEKVRCYSPDYLFQDKVNVIELLLK